MYNMCVRHLQVLVKSHGILINAKNNDEISKTRIRCKRITFVSSFMLQTFITMYLDENPGKDLAFCEKHLVTKYTPIP